MDSELLKMMNTNVTSKSSEDDDKVVTPAPQRELGTVIFASYVKGYGFIRTDTPGADVWFHVSHVNGEGIAVGGQRVSYVLSLDHRDRPRAQDIRLEVD